MAKLDAKPYESEAYMGELIKIDDYLERKTGPTPQELRERLADIAIQQMLLSSERIRLQALLEKSMEKS